MQSLFLYTQDDLRDSFEDYLNLGLNAPNFRTLLPKWWHPLLKIFIEQIGVDLHAQVAGETYIWTQKYANKWVPFTKRCGAHWVQEVNWLGFPQTWKSEWIALFAKSIRKDFISDGFINLTDPEDWDKLVQASLELFKEVYKQIQKQAHTFWLR